MEEYFYFKTKERRDNFFEDIKRFSKLKWKEINNQTKISKTSLEGYKRGFNIPENRFKKLIDYIPLEYQKEILNSIQKLSSNLWLSKGGKKAYQINFNKFKEGRDKGMKTIKERKKNKEIKINFDLSKELCEVIGAFIGDGFFNCYKNKLYQIEFAGDSRKDLDYYTQTIIPTIKLFVPSIKPHIYYVKNKNSIRVVFYSKELFYFLKEGFSFTPGVKTYTIKIPEIIMNSNEEFINSTIRGIFDTDGYVFLDKRKNYKNPYPRVSIQIASYPLHLQLKDYLSKYFKLYTKELINRKIYCLDIYGHNQLNIWMSKIGFSNKRHLNKIVSVA
ncbi:MAG: LAGLIDADG family homing endonuclease [Candidatus Pacearchaeota archaeon]